MAFTEMVISAVEDEENKKDNEQGGQLSHGCVSIQLIRLGRTKILPVRNYVKKIKSDIREWMNFRFDMP